jgi:hypothetical protein
MQDLRVNRDEDEVIMETAYSRQLDTALVMSGRVARLFRTLACSDHPREAIALSEAAKSPRRNAAKPSIADRAYA